mgnify:FL=1
MDAAAVGSTEKRLNRSGTFKESELHAVVNILVEGKPLPAQYQDHGLAGNMNEFRECHIRSDLLLVYKIEDDKLVLVLARIGSHSEIL